MILGDRAAQGQHRPSRGSPGRTMAGVASVLLAGLVAASAARAQARVSVFVDASVAGAPLQRVWSFHGYDEINTTTLPEGKALLSTLVTAHTAPLYVRSHFLFNSGDGAPAMKWGSTNVYSEDTDGQPVYSWALTDGIMDTITALGALPLVEIGFMPQALSPRPTRYRNSSTFTLDSGCFYPPTDHTRWADLIRAWARHASERYPDVEAKWLWELWNEPDIGYFRGTVEDYNKLYDYTEAALHEVLPNATFGGPAVVYPEGAFLRQFLDHCASGVNAVTGLSGTRLDLVTFHAKGGVALSAGHPQMDLGNQLRLHRSGFEAVAAFAPFREKPIIITEADPEGCAACPASSDSANAYRLSSAYGAYEIAMMKHTMDLSTEVGVRLTGVLTWAFTFPDTPFFAGYRVLSTNGVHLPVLGAFKLLGRLAGSRLPLASTGARELKDILANGVRGQPDVNGMATLDGNEIQVLVWNYHDDVVAAEGTPVRLSIKLPSDFGRRVSLSHLRVDEAHGNAYTVWLSQGMPPSPSTAELAALQQAMEPAGLVSGRTLAKAADGSVSVDLDLPRFAVSLVTLLPAADTDEDAVTAHGCACDISGRQGHAPGAILLGLGGLALITFARRSAATIERSAKCPGTTPARPSA